MVEVDVFWSYGLGATLGVASARQTLARREARKPKRGEERRSEPLVDTRDPHLLGTVVFLALLFVPSGAWLVWSFPSWETMHVGDRAMPGWLIAAFALTNVTQGLLAYLVVERLLVAGRAYLAYLQILVGYLGMFFILVHGWDGKGYQRFFSATRHDFVTWDGDWTAWLGSDVALTLYGMGAVIVPVLLWLVVRWTRAGFVATGEAPLPAVAIVAITLMTIFGVALALAVIAHLMLTWFGTVIGLVCFAAVVGVVVMPGGPAHALYRRLRLPGAPSVRPRRAERMPAVAAG